MTLHLLILWRFAARAPASKGVNLASALPISGATFFLMLASVRQSVWWPSLTAWGAQQSSGMCR